MTNSFNILINKIETEFPELITNEMLISLGLGNHLILFRIRKSGQLPFIKLSSARIVYLKEDVIEWLKKSYQKNLK
jgi:hypothetical protein